MFSILNNWLREIKFNLGKDYVIFNEISSETKEIIISYCLRLFLQSLFAQVVQLFTGEKKIEGYKVI